MLLQDTNAVVFVVDSADRERIEYSRQELEIMLQEEKLKGVPVLILENKYDFAGCMNEQEIYQGLGLSNIKTDNGRCIKSQPCKEPDSKKHLNGSLECSKDSEAHRILA